MIGIVVMLIQLQNLLRNLRKLLETNNFDNPAFASESHSQDGLLFDVLGSPVKTGKKNHWESTFCNVGDTRSRNLIKPVDH